jgi:hypothetical protein
MPRRKDNPTNPISAMFGERVLVQPYGKDFIITCLKPRRRKKSSEAQEDCNDKFSVAVRYAKSVLNDPKLKAKYKRKLKGYRNLYQAALSDYMKKNDD